MQFIDNSAHIFNLKEYTQNPIGYEYDEQDYIFWFNDSNNNNHLSINNYYGKIINILYEVDNITDLENTVISNIYDIDLTLESEIFSMIKVNEFQNALHQEKSILNNISISETNKYQKLDSNQDDEILILKVSEGNKNYIMIPIYVVANAKYVGTWLSNILIHINNKYSNKEVWCPITIGGIFNAEYESLTINGRNMGVNLPHEILKAINGTPFDNDVFDEELYNKKLKEYMINYMGIKGECGNYNSAIQSLKWFGFGKYLNIYKLIETDNEFKNQYVRDYFEIHTDLIKAFRFFINTQYISLQFKLNEDTGERYKQSIKDQFWGEGLPKLRDLTNKETIISTEEYLEDQQFKYLSTYFQYSLYDLMFKLSCLAYYYQTYFLPMFITLRNLNVEYKVYANDYKELNYVHDHYYEPIIDACGDKLNITFSKENFLYFTHQKHLVDKNFNEIKYLNTNNTQYLINDTCLFIPIKFPEFGYYNCILILKDNLLNQIIYKSQFAFVSNQNCTYNGFVFYPKMIEELSDLHLYTYVNKSYTVYLNVNNYWYEYTFTSKIHELDVHIGTLEYKYWINDINYFNYLYHLNSQKDENGEIIKNVDPLGRISYVNNTKVIFNFYNKEDGQKDDSLDITEYIENKDFFDSPTKYFSNFTQIDYIDDNQVHFNSYMNDSDFVHVNSTQFGLYQKKYKDLLDSEISQSIKKDITELVNKYQENINISHNSRYLNRVHLYDLYKKELSLKDKSGNILDLLKFKSNLRALCDNILIERSSSLDNTLRISFVNQISKEINTKDDYNYYLNEEFNELNNSITLKEDSAWYYILSRDENGNIITPIQSANSLYTIKEDYDKKINIGYFIYKIDEIRDSQSNINLNVDFSKEPILSSMLDNFHYKNVEYDSLNQKLYYTTEDYKYLLYFHFTPYLKIKTNNQDQFVQYTPELYQQMKSSELVDKSIYARLDFYYYDIIKILNLYGYYSESLINNVKPLSEDFVKIDDNSAICTLNLPNKNGGFTKYTNVPLTKSSKYIRYYDSKYINKLTELSGDNPSLYWATYDEENDVLIDGINKNNLYHYNEIENVDFDNDENYTFKYINYLCKNITGLSGNFIPCCEFNKNGDKRNLFVICVDIIDENDNHLDIQEFDNILETNSNYNQFKRLELTGKEKQVLLYFKINSNYSSSTFTVIPHLYKYWEINQKIKYLPKDQDKNYDKNLVDFYKEFYYKRYSIDLLNSETNELNTIKEIWDSYIHITSNEEYDMYLMHGPETLPIEGQEVEEYWYIMFISKNTCNLFENLVELNQYPQEINFKDYYLKHQSKRDLFLINRMKVNYKKNIYHFNQDDIIVCSLYNNKMLPVNLNISSKWNIKPVTFGANTSKIIYSNTNTAIISITSNNTYDKGYYDLSIKYSLDNNVLNTQEINKKILIK